MADAAEQLNDTGDDLSFDEQFEADWDAAEVAAQEAAAAEEVETKPEGEEAPGETAAKPEDQPPEGEQPGEQEQAAEQPQALEPLHHWPDEYKTAFNSMPPAAQAAVMERERNFERGYQQKAAEANAAGQAVQQFRDMISPRVEHWQRQGLSPSQGLMRMVALERDLQQNPAEALMGLAQQYGVDLAEATKDQPYQHPEVASLRQEISQLQAAQQQREQKERQAAEQSQQHVRHQVYSHIQQFVGTQNADGSPAYPYANDPMVIQLMSQQLDEGRAHNLGQAYEGAMATLKQHPLFRDTQAQQQSTQADVEKAKSASKTVQASKTTGTEDIDDDDAAILRELEAAGLE